MERHVRIPISDVEDVFVQKIMNYYGVDRSDVKRVTDVEYITFEISGKCGKEWKKTGRWLCDFCYNRYDPNRKNLYRERYGVVANSRTGNILQGSNKEKGDMLTIDKYMERSKILSIENDCYIGPIDHSRDPELGIIQTKGRFYNSVNRMWSFSGLEREYNKEFDFMISYCADKDGKCIEKIYIFPKSEIIKRKGVTIVKNPSRWTPWYEQYRVIDEETIKKINDIWKKIIKR